MGNEPLDGSRYSALVRIDTEKAPITHALAMKFQMMDAEVQAKPEGERLLFAASQMYPFLADLIAAVHQLETGETMKVVALPE